jgi:tagatose-1,6-bisphosphate aldolase non-catalytic subunit AgaZ/GatZ
MRGWLRRRRERAERIETEAEELIRLLGGDAYGEARWREQMASSRAMAQEWDLIALAIGRQAGRRLGLDVSTRMAMNAVFAPDREPARRKPSRSDL